MFSCKLTSRNFTTSKGLLNHLLVVYPNLTMEKIYEYEVGLAPTSCIKCDEPTKFISFFKGYGNVCDNRECIKHRVNDNIKNTILTKKSDYQFIKWLADNIDDVMHQYNNSNKVYISFYNIHIEPKKLRIFLSKRIIGNDKLGLIDVDITCKHCEKEIHRSLFKHDFTIFCSTACHIKERNKNKPIIEKVVKSKPHRPVNANNIHKCFYCGEVFNRVVCKSSIYVFCDRNCYTLAKRDSNIRDIIQPITEKTKLKLSQRMKANILDGKFTPRSNNRFTHKTLRYNGIFYRSTWELMFHLLEPTIKYEKLRIPYTDVNNNNKIYIVDFISDTVAYEVKPKSMINGVNELLKYNALVEYAIKNNLIVKIISEDYLIHHKTELMVLIDRLPIDISALLTNALQGIIHNANKKY